MKTNTIIFWVFIIISLVVSDSVNAQKAKRRKKKETILESLQRLERSRLQEAQEQDSTKEYEEYNNQQGGLVVYLGDDVAEEEEYKPSINVQLFMQKVEQDISRAKKKATQNQYDSAIQIVENVYDRLYDNRVDIENEHGAKKFNADTLLILLSKWNYSLNNLEESSIQLKDYFNSNNNPTITKKLLLYKATVHYKMQDFYDAIDTYNLLLKDYKLNDSLRFYCLFYSGIAKYNLEEYEHAYADFKKCSNLKPNNFEPYYNMGRCLFRDLVTRENLKLAINWFDKALILNKFHLPSLFLKARSYERLKKYDVALKNFKKCTELDPNYQDAYYKKAYMMYKLNKNRVRRSICDEFLKAVRLGSGEALLFHEEYCKRR